MVFPFRQWRAGVLYHELGTRERVFWQKEFSAHIHNVAPARSRWHIDGWADVFRSDDTIAHHRVRWPGRALPV